jgi:hypothetical protein
VRSASRLFDDTGKTTGGATGFFNESLGDLASFDNVGMISQLSEVLHLLC